MTADVKPLQALSRTHFVSRMAGDGEAPPPSLQAAVWHNPFSLRHRRRVLAHEAGTGRKPSSCTFDD